jgi:signal transduction histidine kinase
MAESPDNASVVPTLVPSAADAEFELFAHALAHDLRAPLRAIGGFSEVLLETPEGQLEPMAREYLPRIVAASTRMAQLLDDLLELARIANAPCIAQEADLRSAAMQIVDDLRFAEPDREVEVRIADECAMKGDPLLLRAALQRLFANAWKFTRPVEHPRIEFGCTRQPGETMAWVSDNGTGFDAKQAHRLFQPLQRLHRADQFAGSGVGLAIVKRIVERHGGRVWAENLERGARFCFALPD